MANLILSGSTSGSVTLSSPAVSGTTTLTLPTTSGTVLTTASTFGGTGPAFSAYPSSAQSISGGTWTKIQYNTEEFDTNSNYDTSNYRFTPTVAGYYQVSAAMGGSSITSAYYGTAIYKNGSEFKDGMFYSVAAAGPRGGLSALVYLNGSTDYVEIYGLSQNGFSLGTSSNSSYFQAVMVRGA